MWFQRSLGSRFGNLLCWCTRQQQVTESFRFKLWHYALTQINYGCKGAYTTPAVPQPEVELHARREGLRNRRSSVSALTRIPWNMINCDFNTFLVGIGTRGRPGSAINSSMRTHASGNTREWVSRKNRAEKLRFFSEIFSDVPVLYSLEKILPSCKLSGPLHVAAISRIKIF